MSFLSTMYFNHCCKNRPRQPSAAPILLNLGVFMAGRPIYFNKIKKKNSRQRLGGLKTSDDFLLLQPWS